MLEATSAACLLLLTVAAVSGCVVGVSRAGARLEAHMNADRGVWAAAELLRGLPFCAATYPQLDGGRGATADDLVAAVFPHARSSESTAAARYVPTTVEGDEPAGSFVTIFPSSGVRVHCVARFFDGPEGLALDPSELEGWEVAEAARPPAATLVVVLTPESGGRGIRLVRTASSLPTATPESKR